jgi:hypothetical protein
MFARPKPGHQLHTIEHLIERQLLRPHLLIASKQSLLANFPCNGERELPFVLHGQSLAGHAGPRRGTPQKIWPECERCYPRRTRAFSNVRSHVLVLNIVKLLLFRTVTRRWSRITK